MRRLDRLRLWLRSLLHGKRVDQELDGEIRFHLDQQIEENIAAGMTREEARFAALRMFGGEARIKEECREMRAMHWLETFLRDARFGLRALRASPVFTLTAITSLVLGIGANTAVFTLLHVALWKPMPVVAPEQIYHLMRTASDHVEADAEYSYSYVLFRELSVAAKPFGELIGASSAGRKEFGVGESSGERAELEFVSSNYFSVLGINPALGRVLELQDDNPLGGNSVAVLSHAFWMRRFNGDRSILGKTILLNSWPYTVVGVAQEGFEGAQRGTQVDLWTPVTSGSIDPQGRKNLVQTLTSPHRNWIRILMRVRPGTHPGEAEAAMNAVFRSHVERELLPDLNPHFRPMLEAQRLTLRPASSGFATTGRRYQKPLMVLMGVVVLVLLIACANVANLVMARNDARRQEIAIRLALGAGRARVAGQLFVESLLIALAGAVGGGFLAVWATRALVSMLPDSREVFDLRPDGVVLAFTAVIAVATAIFFGLLPAIRAGNDSMLGRGARIIRESLAGRALVAIQLAFSLLLLIGAGLFLGTMRNLKATDLGFERQKVTGFDVVFPVATQLPRIGESYTRIEERLENAGGVRWASFTWPGIYSRGGWSGDVKIDGRAVAANQDSEVCYFRVARDYFETVGMGVLLGRPLNQYDATLASPPVVVNESFARYFFGNESAVGHRVTLGDRPEQSIVGVVRDARHQGVREPVCRTIYMPSHQDGSFLVRSEASPAVLGGIIRDAVQSAGNGARVERIYPLEELVNDMSSRERMIAMLSAVFGGLGLLLAAIGLYGVISYGVSRRTSEIGIRIALGARPGDVRTLVLRETAQVAAIGLAAGLAAGLALTRFAASLLYGIEPTNLAVFAGSTAVLMAVAAFAGFVPARRAARVDPMVALRQQ